jgi:foldase protein PrsA
MLSIKKWGTLLVSAALVLSVFAGCGKSSSDQTKPAPANQATPASPDKSAAENPIPVVKVDLGMNPTDIVAEYDGGTLTADQFKHYLEVQAFINPQAGSAIQAKNADAYKMFVDSYVGETVMAAKAPQTPDLDKQAKELADRIKEQYKSLFNGDESKVEKQMKDQGVTDQDLLEFFTRYKKVEAYLGAGITDADLQKKYNEGKANGDFTVATVRHILITNEKHKDDEAKKLATQLADRLRKGEDFAKLAKQYSEDPGSKDKGGVYEDADVSQWVPEFKKAVLELPIGKISDPVKTQYGYHVIKVEKRSEKTFDQVKALLRSQMINDKYDQFMSQNVKKMIKKENLPQTAAKK